MQVCRQSLFLFFFLVVFKRQGTDSANTVFLSPSILQMFCVCLCYNIFLVVLYIVDQFYSATTRKMESAAYSRLSLYKYPQYTSCKKHSDNAVRNDLVRVITAGRTDARHFHMKKNESCSAWDNKYCVRLQCIKLYLLIVKI